MNPAELEEFARLWRGEEDAEERRVFRRLAWRAGVKAKALRFADYGLAGLIVVAVIVAMLSDGAPATILFGLLFGAAAVWATWKRRLLHQSALLGDANDRESLLGAARGRVVLELRQARWGLLLFPLGILLAAVTKFSAATGGQMERFPAELAGAIVRGERPVLAVIMLVLGEIYFLYCGHRLRRELAGIDLLIGQYRRETRLDRDEAAPGH